MAVLDLSDLAGQDSRYACRGRVEVLLELEKVFPSWGPVGASGIVSLLADISSHLCCLSGVREEEGLYACC